jgi:1-acyl-sn-glycerol-3-phosphate acyltransferase
MQNSQSTIDNTQTAIHNPLMFRYRLIRFAMHMLRLILRIRIEMYGRENIPDQGPYMVVLNHTSVADTPVLLVTFPLIRWRFFAVRKWRNHPVYGPIMSWLGAIYVTPDEIDRQTIREAMAALQEGRAFGLAPEGTRSYIGSMKPAKDGAAYLASRAKVPIVSVGLVNNDRLFANVKRFRPTTVEVHIGKPYLLPDIGRRPKGRDLAAFTHLIMVNIAALLPERYHGVYKDSPALQALLAGEDPWPYCVEQQMGK